MQELTQKYSSHDWEKVKAFLAINPMIKPLLLPLHELITRVFTDKTEFNTTRVVQKLLQEFAGGLSPVGMALPQRF